MPRLAHIIPRHRLSLWVPEDLKARLDLRLYSELEQKIPFGAYTEFFAGLVRRWLEEEELDLSPFTQAQPGTLTVRGSPAAILKLKELLSS